MTSDAQTRVLPAGPASEEDDHPILRAIVRLRWALLAIVVALVALGHNGQWRIGRDSSLYRELARSLEEGRGYTYRGEPHWHVYQGLPRALVAIDRVFGEQDVLRPRAALLAMMGAGLLTLVVVYHLMRSCYPQWVAVVVTLAVGVNPLFVEYNHELMTDLPFMLGVCLALLGLTRLPKAATAGRIAWIVVALAGAVLAMSMRPTFWALAIAFALSSVIGVVKSKRRWVHLGGIAVLVVLLMGAWRLGGRSILNGKYEEAALNHVSQVFSGDWWTAALRTVDRHLPQALFGIELVPPLGALLLAALAYGAVLLMRRNRLWGLYALVTLAMMLGIGSVPRYFLMVLPLLVAEWMLLAQAVSRRLEAKLKGRAPVLAAGLALALGANVVVTCDFILEQHGLTRKLERKPFLEIYRNGKMAALLRMGEAMRQAVPPEQNVLGPEQRILTYLSGRSVWHTSEFRAGNNAEWRKALAAKQIRWCVFGPRFADEKRLNVLLERDIVLVDDDSVIEVGDMRIGRVLTPEEARQQRLLERRAARVAARNAATRPTTRPKDAP